jgi:signal transduction histidine kinase
VIPLVLVSLLLFLLLVKSVWKPLFKSDENLQKSIKETIHELNIPVSTINMNTQLLEKSITDQKSLNRLKRIKQASNNLLKLYENMEYNIKREIDNIDVQEIVLDELIYRCVDKFKDIKADTKIDISIPSIILNTDLNGFEKTIDNLISNAIKYNNKIKPCINIYYENETLCIFNSGDKIDTRNLFIIFEKHFQEDKSSDGFGLGLSMVKEFCDKNKIAIKIDTSKDGNTFILNLENIFLK